MIVRFSLLLPGISRNSSISWVSSCTVGRLSLLARSISRYLAALNSLLLFVYPPFEKALMPIKTFPLRALIHALKAAQSCRARGMFCFCSSSIANWTAVFARYARTSCILGETKSSRQRFQGLHNVIDKFNFQLSKRNVDLLAHECLVNALV